MADTPFVFSLNPPALVEDPKRFYLLLGFRVKIQGFSGSVVQRFT
jgi:hypothetical protein